MCNLPVKDIYLVSPYSVMELELAELMQELSVEVPPPTPPEQETETLRSENSEGSSTVGSMSDDDGGETISASDSPHTPLTSSCPLWSDQYNELEPQRPVYNLAILDTPLPPPIPPAYSFLPHDGQLPPPYFPPSKFGPTFSHSAFPGPLFDVQIDFGELNSAPVGFFTPPPQPYTALPDSQDFGLHFFQQEFQGLLEMSTRGGNAEFGMVGFNPSLTPPPPYETMSLKSQQPIPFLLDTSCEVWNEPWNRYGGPMGYHPHFQPYQSMPQPRPYFTFGPVGMGQNSSVMFPHTATPLQPLVMTMPMLWQFPPQITEGSYFPSVIGPTQSTVTSQRRPPPLHRSSTYQQRSDESERVEEPSTIQHSKPHSSLSNAEIQGARGLNPYSATFVPKTSNTYGNFELYRHQPFRGHQNKNFCVPMQYRLDPPNPLQKVEDFSYTGDNLPYVSNLYDAKHIAGLKLPPPNFSYYVPPRVDDNDYFGGQIHIWQDKMLSCFRFYCPDLWILQGLPDFNKRSDEGWSHFTITCKLRFCCRNCLRPWTSMRGKVHFAFKLESNLRRGLIVMKIFGQVCNHEKCNDRKFQTPACYPEEIERVLWKLSEYVGFLSYNIPLSAQFYNEPDKAIRIGNPKSPHRPALCQACQHGMCTKV